MASQWLGTVAIGQKRARRHLPSSVCGALIAGSERGVTLADKIAAFDEVGFLPLVADLPATRQLATTVMGQEISLPVLCSPTGVQAVHPDGEVAVARAAAARGALEGAGLEPLTAELTLVPGTTAEGSDPAAAHRVLRLLAAIDDHDEPQGLHANHDIPDTVLGAHPR